MTGLRRTEEGGAVRASPQGTAISHAAKAHQPFAPAPRRSAQPSAMTTPGTRLHMNGPATDENLSGMRDQWWTTRTRTRGSDLAATRESRTTVATMKI